MTDRSPRTPPAPRCTKCGHTRGAHGIEQPYPCFATLMGRRCSCESYSVEPPAPSNATPRPTLDELLDKARQHVMTPEEKEAQRQSWMRGEMALSEHERGMTSRLPMPAAAEPPEARASIYLIERRIGMTETWEPVTDRDRQLYMAEHVALSVASALSATHPVYDYRVAEYVPYAADLQRQLDNWKANARTAREYWRSAEAANQELRRACELALTKMGHSAKCMVPLPTEEWATRGSWSFDNCCCEIATVRAALLGPQHGQKESE